MFAGAPALFAIDAFGGKEKKKKDDQQAANQAIGGMPVRGSSLNGMNPNGMMPGNMFNMNGQRNGFFSVPPEKTVEIHLTTVCLEHGKKDPRPAVPYELRPIESITSRAAVHALCKMLGQNGIDQSAVQAAVWHEANGMTWEQLAAKRIEHINPPSEPYFTAEQIAAAKELAKTAETAAQAQKPAATASP